MWNADWVEFTRTDCVSALVRWNTTQIIKFKSSSTPTQLRVISAHLSSHRQWVWVDPLLQYSGDCDQVVVAAGGSRSHVCASVPDYIRSSCVRLRFCRTLYKIEINNEKDDKKQRIYVCWLCLVKLVCIRKGAHFSSEQLSCEQMSGEHFVRWAYVRTSYLLPGRIAMRTA